MKNVILALVLLSSPALAQKAELPDVKAGDQWNFAVYYTVPSSTPNRTWVIKSVTASGVEATENGEPLTLTRELNVLESPRDRQSNPKALSFPLEVGKRWRYTSDWVFKPKGSTGGSTVDVAVVGYEKVKVPAGELDAFKLVAKGSLSGTSPINSEYAGETVETYWYAPAARAVVKSVRHNPYLGTTTVELVELRLQPATHAQDRLGILKAVAMDIEKLKTDFPQLRDFSAAKHLRAEPPSIWYAFRTHAPERRGGWTSGVPNPDADGVWFHIDLHDPDSNLQLHTQPVTAALCLGASRISFLMLEGQETSSLYGPIWSALAKQGARECAR